MPWGIKYPDIGKKKKKTRRSPGEKSGEGVTPSSLLTPEERERGDSP